MLRQVRACACQMYHRVSPASAGATSRGLGVTGISVTSSTVEFSAVVVTPEGQEEGCGRVDVAAGERLCLPFGISKSLWFIACP
jgi:hypothetical protein